MSNPRDVTINELKEVGEDDPDLEEYIGIRPSRHRIFECIVNAR